VEVRGAAAATGVARVVLLLSGLVGRLGGVGFLTGRCRDVGGDRDPLGRAAELLQRRVGVQLVGDLAGVGRSRSCRASAGFMTPTLTAWALAVTRFS
jgi:hypothetical protein